ncbi:MAG: acyltransferase, partial [Micavibrio aeruginosavorus]
MKYRPEIDGLRALAISLVVLYHMSIPHIPGGFIGVDVFFVISGYLITSIICRDIAASDFSIAHFYERRIRRIIPVFLVVIIATTFMAWLLFLPPEFAMYGKSLAASSAFVSNIFFYREAGYFDPSATVKPLLHTWSLGVEEQFYIFFPIFALLSVRYFKRAFLPLLLTGAVFSFILCVVLLAVNK